MNRPLHIEDTQNHRPSLVVTPQAGGGTLAASGPGDLGRPTTIDTVIDTFIATGKQQLRRAGWGLAA